LGFVPQLRCGRKFLQGIVYYEWPKKGHLFLGSTESQKNRLLWEQ